MYTFVYIHFLVCEAPTKIDMYTLLTQDSRVEGGLRPKRTLKGTLIIHIFTYTLHIAHTCHIHYWVHLCHILHIQYSIYILIIYSAVYHNYY